MTLTNIELVALRASVRAFQHGHQSKYRPNVASSERPTYPQVHPLGHFRHYRTLQRFFLLYVHLPVHSF